jgi:hypothetical protein
MDDKFTPDLISKVCPNDSKIKIIPQKINTNTLNFFIQLKFVMSPNNLAHNVGSYTQGRTAGGFLSSRKAARAERCPPKTTAAGLAGS